MFEFSENTLAGRIERGLKAADLSPRAASLKVSDNADLIRTIYQAERDGREYNPRIDTIEKIARALGVTVASLRQTETPDPHANLAPGPALRSLPVRGEVAAGMWLETDHLVEDYDIQEWVMGFSAQPGMEQFTYALRVRGTSINKIAPDGSHLVVIDMGSGIEIHDGDLVIVERSRDQGGFREVTAKRLVTIDGEHMLVPESHDPKWQKAVPLEPAVQDDGTEVRIIAKVKHIIINP